MFESYGFWHVISQFFYRARVVPIQKGTQILPEGVEGELELPLQHEGENGRHVYIIPSDKDTSVCQPSREKVSHFRGPLDTPSSKWFWSSDLSSPGPCLIPMDCLHKARSMQ